MDEEKNDKNISYFPNKKQRSSIKKEKLVKNTFNDEPIINIPETVKILCTINIVAFIITEFFADVIGRENIYNMSFVPARYFNTTHFDFATIYSLITHMFIHAGWMHLTLNLCMLLALGAGLEKIFNKKKFLLFYFATGICGALTHLAFYPSMESPMIGASGAISGLFGGIVIAMQTNTLTGTNYKSLIPVVILWVAISLFFGFFGMPGSDSAVAWATHIGGFIAGIVLFKPIGHLNI